MVWISDIADAMSYGDGFSAYYDRTDDKVVFLSDLEELKEETELRELIDSDEVGRFVFISRETCCNEDWDNLARFISTVEDEKERELLSEAISGKGAFRRFRTMVERLGLLDRWYLFKDDLLDRRAREWCEENDVVYAG